MPLSRRQRLIRFLEFLVIGIAMGLVEDLLAVWLATDAAITIEVVLIVLAVAVPFAAISELLVDHPRFWDGCCCRAPGSPRTGSHTGTTTTAAIQGTAATPERHAGQEDRPHRPGACGTGRMHGDAAGDRYRYAARSEKGPSLPGWPHLLLPVRPERIGGHGVRLL